MVVPMRRLLKLFAGLSGALTFLMAHAAIAQEAHYSAPWQRDLQTAVGPTAEMGHDFWHLLLYIIIGISVFVLLLLGYVIIRFRAKANPEPSRTSHNTMVEVIWTIVPVIILLVIFVPSMRLLYFTDKVADADLTVKAVGHQWYWTYEYPDQGFEFDAVMVEDEDLQPGQPRLLETDMHVVLPVGAKVRLLTTSTDVIHSWALPSFFVKMDAVPGRLNETWFEAVEEGVFYGQCSELCGVRHGFMPITVEVVSQARFNSWVNRMKEEFAAVEGSPSIRVASVETGALR